MAMDFAEEIALLQAERQKEIGLFHFDKAEAIEQSITELRRNSQNLKTSHRTLHANHLFEREQHEALATVHVTSLRLTQEIYEARARHERDLITVRARQATELSALTSDLANELALVATRSLPPVNLLLRDAQMQAQLSRYPFAASLSEDAERLRSDLIRDQQQTLHDQFATRQEQMIAKHRSFDESFQSKLDYDLTEIHRKFGMAMDVCKHRIQTAALKYGIAITEREVDELLAKYRLDDDEVPRPVTPPRKPRPASPVSPRLFNEHEFVSSPIAARRVAQTPKAKSSSRRRRGVAASANSFD
jgi:hypothetical protein